jgi:hypothetical protein
VGYTTRFSGGISVSPPITLHEAEVILRTADGRETELKVAGRLYNVTSYLQWVPDKSLKYLVWNEGEKFYEYDAWLQIVIKYLKDNDPSRKFSGSMSWAGENVTDTGVVQIIDGLAVFTRAYPSLPDVDEPLSWDDLADLTAQAKRPE